MEILVAEDDPTSRHILKALLGKWGYRVKLACDGAQAWEALQENSVPRLVILDWMMPHMDGLEICKRLRSQEAQTDHYTYIILLTAKGAKDDVIQGMEAGADDYLVKPFDPQELRVRLRAGERIIQLQLQLHAAQEELKRQSMADPLTGILNRRAVFERLEIEISRALREGTKLGVCLMDIDHFKSINDTFGHLCGDEVLKEVCSRIRRSLRAYDCFGRIGGEEFLIVIPGSNVLTCIAVAERLRGVIFTQPVCSSKGPIRVSSSFGVTELVPGEGIDPLLERADRALYRAKAMGRNRVESVALEEVAKSVGK